MSDGNGVGFITRHLLSLLQQQIVEYVGWDHANSPLVRLDSSGAPALVQSLVWFSRFDLYCVKFFDGTITLFPNFTSLDPETEDAMRTSETHATAWWMKMHEANVPLVQMKSGIVH